MHRAEQNLFNGTLHCVLDFAEFVLLPYLLRNSGQLHFNTGIKFDLFEVVVSIGSSTDIFFLPEVHFPGHRSANDVTSMLHYSIITANYDLNLPFSRLLLYSDDCGRHKKNGYILWYLLSLEE